MVKHFRILIPFLLMQQIGKTVNARQPMRMLLAQQAPFPPTSVPVYASLRPLRIYLVYSSPRLDCVDVHCSIERIFASSCNATNEKKRNETQHKKEVQELSLQVRVQLKTTCCELLIWPLLIVLALYKSLHLLM